MTAQSRRDEPWVRSSAQNTWVQLGAKPRGVHIIVRSLALWKLSFVGFPLWVKTENPASLADTLPQIPGTSRSLPEQAELFTEAGKRWEGQRSPSGILIIFVRKIQIVRYSLVQQQYIGKFTRHEQMSPNYCFYQTPQIRVTLAKLWIASNHVLHNWSVWEFWIIQRYRSLFLIHRD